MKTKTKDPFRKYEGHKAVYQVREGRSLLPLPENDIIWFGAGEEVTLPVDYAEEHAKHLVEYVRELDGTELPVTDDGTTTRKPGTSSNGKKKAKKKAGKKAASKKKVAKKKASRRPVDANANRRAAARKKAGKKKAGKKKASRR